MTFYAENESGMTFDFSYEELAESVAGEVLLQENGPKDVQINLLITDNEGIREYNKQYREIDRETDVLSFPNVDFESPADFSVVFMPEFEADYKDPESGEVILGDIILSAQKVFSQAEEYGHSVKREFAFLIAHSMLHLCGYDHMEEAEAKDMEARQETVLKKLGITRD